LNYRKRADTLIEIFEMRQNDTASVLWKCMVDDLGAGTTFHDVCSGGSVPTFDSTWGHVKNIYR
jgi:hypothetical protein